MTRRPPAAHPAPVSGPSSLVPGDAADVEAAPSLSQAIAAFQAHVESARRTFNGRELTLFEAQPETMGRLVDALASGNYRDTSATLAGITSRALRMWMDKAEKGDARYESVAQLVRVAEAFAESVAVANVRKAGRDPRFWAAEMTYLERRHPDRWGRRQDGGDSPKVIVQIGVKDSDVQVCIGDATPSA